MCFLSRAVLYDWHSNCIFVLSANLFLQLSCFLLCRKVWKLLKRTSLLSYKKWTCYYWLVWGAAEANIFISNNCKQGLWDHAHFAITVILSAHLFLQLMYLICQNLWTRASIGLFSTDTKKTKNKNNPPKHTKKPQTKTQHPAPKPPPRKPDW